MKKIGALIILLAAFGFANAATAQGSTGVYKIDSESSVAYHGHAKHLNKKAVRKAKKRNLRREVAKHKIHRHVRNCH